MIKERTKRTTEWHGAKYEVVLISPRKNFAFVMHQVYPKTLHDDTLNPFIHIKELFIPKEFSKEFSKKFSALKKILYQRILRTKEFSVPKNFPYQRILRNKEFTRERFLPIKVIRILIKSEEVLITLSEKIIYGEVFDWLLKITSHPKPPGGGSPLSRTSLKEEMLRVKNRQRQLRIALSGTSQKG